MKHLFNLYLDREFLVLIFFGLKISIKLKSTLNLEERLSAFEEKMSLNNNEILSNYLENNLCTIQSYFHCIEERLSTFEERTLLSNGEMLSKLQRTIDSNNINEYEFKIFSQHGDDGIIQYLIKNIQIRNDIFIEFGVENYQESNTRFLLMNNNWTGFVMDGSIENIKYLQNRPWYWRYDITSKSVFIDRDNINTILNETGFQNIGILSIDLDGNDYWIFEEIDLSKLNPSIIILEYNSVFGKDRAITVPYDKKFNRTEKHYSNLYFGASLKALEILADANGYSLVSATLLGNNAYFVRKDLLNSKIKARNTEDIYVYPKFRESRNSDGSLSYISGEKRLELIRGLDVFNVITKQYEKL